MCKCLREYQDRIEAALSLLAGELCAEVSMLGAVVKVCENGDVSADILIDKDGSAFRIEISEGGDSVLRKHYMVKDLGHGHAAGKGRLLAQKSRKSQMRDRLIRYKNAAMAKGLWN